MLAPAAAGHVRWQGQRNRRPTDHAAIDNAWVQPALAARAANQNTEARYKLGATPFYATLTAGQQYRSANVQVIRATAARLADTAALLDSMGEPQVAAGRGLAKVEP